METSQVINHLVSDPFFCQGPDAGTDMGAIHIASHLSPKGLESLALLRRDELCVTLRSRMARTNPHLPAEEIRQRADRCQQSLEAAMLRHMDKALGEHAARELKAAAEDIRLIASHADLSLMQICEGSELDPDSQQAILESLLGDDRLAEGLTIRLRNKPKSLLKQLLAGRRVALPQSTVDLGEIQQAMYRTAQNLDALAARLQRPGARQGQDCIDLCPDLALGLFQALPADSCLAQALAERQDFHRRCQALDRGFKMAGSLLLDIGACFVPVLAAAGATYNLGFALADGRDAAARGQMRLLGSLAAQTSPARRRQWQQERNRALGQAYFSASSATTLANSYFSELTFGIDSQVNQDINRSAGGPRRSRSDRPAGSPAR